MTSACKLTAEEICKLPSAKWRPVNLSLKCPDIDYPSRRRYLIPGETLKGHCSVDFRSTEQVESAYVRLVGTSTTSISGESETHVIADETVVLINPPEKNLVSVEVRVGTMIKQNFEFSFPEIPACTTDESIRHTTCIAPVTDFNHIDLSTGHIGTVKYQVELVVKIVGRGEFKEIFPFCYENEAGKGQVVIESEPITMHLKGQKPHHGNVSVHKDLFSFRALYVRPQFYKIHKEVRPTVLLVTESLPHGATSEHFYLKSSTFKFEETLKMTTGKKTSTFHKTSPLINSSTAHRINLSDFKPASTLGWTRNQLEASPQKLFCDISSLFQPFMSDGESFFGGSVRTCNISSVGRMLIRLNFATTAESIFTKTAVLDHESTLARR